LYRLPVALSARLAEIRFNGIDGPRNIRFQISVLITVVGGITMRKSLCSLVLTGVLTVAGSAAFAQSDSPAQPPSAMAPAGHRGINPDEQLARMTKDLNLTSDQATQIKPILVTRQQQMQTLRQDQSMSQEDKMAKMKSLRDDSNSKISAVLNDTQKQQFGDMQAKQQQRMQPPPPQQ
jgi:periplasmic protein CpxP/Spy